jgi:hypothetical protein
VLAGAGTVALAFAVQLAFVRVLARRRGTVPAPHEHVRGVPAQS